MKTSFAIRILSFTLFMAFAGIFLSTDTARADDSYSETISDTGDNNAVLTGIEIGGVEAPKAGEAFDSTATVTAAGGQTWEIPVFWLGPQEEPAAVVNLEDQTRPLTASDGSLWKFVVFENDAAEGETPSTYAAFNVVTTDGKTVAMPVYPIQNAGEAPEPVGTGIYYRPLLVFFLPEGKASSGTIALDKYLAGAFNLAGGIITIPDEESGITYITGMVRGSTLPGILNSLGSSAGVSAAAEAAADSEGSQTAQTDTAESQADNAEPQTDNTESQTALADNAESQSAQTDNAEPQADNEKPQADNEKPQTTQTDNAKKKTLPPLDPTVIRPAWVPEFPFD